MNIYTANCVHRVTKKFETIHILAKDQNHATELLRTTHYRILFAKSYQRKGVKQSKAYEQVHIYQVLPGKSLHPISKPEFVKENPAHFEGMTMKVINLLIKHTFTDRVPKLNPVLNKED